MDAQLKKGVLEVCVLSAIENEESYGYKIISDLEPYNQHNYSRDNQPGCKTEIESECISELLKYRRISVHHRKIQMPVYHPLPKTINGGNDKYYTDDQQYFLHNPILFSNR